VFLHEVAHVARHDGLGLLLARIATSLFWFHPLVWKLARVARRECERSCDDMVLAAGERATDYAEHLLAIVRSMTRRDPFAGMAPALAQRSNLEARLVSILRAGQRRGSVSRPRVLATVAGAALLLVATAVVQVVAAQDRTDSESWAGDPATKVTQNGSENPGACTGTVQGVEEEAPPLSPEMASEGEQRFQAGGAAFKQGGYVRAASSYLAAGAIGYRRPESFYRAACALAKAGANEDALNALGAAVEAGFDQSELIGADPNLEGLRADPRFLAIVTPKTPEVPEVPDVPAQWYSVAGSLDKKSYVTGQSGIEFMRAGQYERAITAFEEEIKMTGSSNAMYNLACAYAQRGDKRRAFDALENAIENGFDNSQHMVEDEDLRLIQGDPHFYQLVRLTKDLQLFGSGRSGNGMKDEDDWRQSLSRFERVTREHPEFGRAWANLGYARLEAGDPKGAAAAYQRALELGYRKPTMMYNVACCAARSGNVDEAFRWLDKADKAGFEVGEYAGSDSDLDALRDDPRYDDLLERWDQNMARKHLEKEKTEKTD
jgi:tetratricopeptide (TPR) repeat protein